MSLCDTRKAMKMGATNVEKRSLKTKHLAPIFRAELRTDYRLPTPSRQAQNGFCCVVRGAGPRECPSPLAQTVEFRRILEQPRDRRRQTLRVFDPAADPLPFDPIAGPSFVAGKRIDGEQRRSEERRVGKECRSRWSPYH